MARRVQVAWVGVQVAEIERTSWGDGEAERARLVGALERHLRRRNPGLRILALRPLVADAASGGATSKARGYGAPVEIVAREEGRERRLVLHRYESDEYGHDRTSDRVAEALAASETFARVPRHARAVDVGVFDAAGELASLRGTGEPFLLTEWVDGSLYAEELRAVGSRGEATEIDRARIVSLVRYLDELHVPVRGGASVYRRATRDALGHGEGVFGIVDAYPDDVPGAPLARLRALEHALVDARWRLRHREARLSRIHGDFHPFNVLFDVDGQVVTLDASRGAAGEPADDIAALAVNFVFFALERPDSWARGYGVLWRDFFDGYLSARRDPGLLEALAPYLAWRALVVASPRWYPRLSAGGRDKLLTLAEEALREPRFDPVFAEELMR